MKKKNVIIIIGLIVFIATVVGVSYSYFVYNKDVADVSLSTGDIAINLANINGSINLSNTVPKSDNEGKISTDYIDFTVNSTVDSEKIYYEIYILPKSGNTLNTTYLKTYLTDQSENELKGVTSYNDLSNSTIENGKTLYRGVVELNNSQTTRNETKNFRLRLWLDESYPDLTTKIFDFDVYLYAKNVPEDFSLSAVPSCPDCMFIYTEDIIWFVGNGSSVTPTVISSGASEDYQDVITATGKSYFLGVVLNGNNQVTKAYACGVYNGTTPFCVDQSSSVSDSETYLNGANLWNNTCTRTDENILRCGAWNGTTVSAGYNNYAFMAVSGISNDNNYCYARDDRAQCYVYSCTSGHLCPPNDTWS